MGTALLRGAAKGTRTLRKTVRSGGLGPLPSRDRCEYVGPKPSRAVTVVTELTVRPEPRTSDFQSVLSPPWTMQVGPTSFPGAEDRRLSNWALELSRPEFDCM